MISRERPPLAVLLYLLGRHNLLVWHSPDEFVALRPPDTASSGDPRAVRLSWLDRWWHLAVVWLPPFLALGLALSCVFVPTMRLPGLLLAMSTLVYGAIMMAVPVLADVVRLCRRFVGTTSNWPESGRQLIEQNWSISLCHVTDPDRTEELLQATRDHVGNLIFATRAARSRNSTMMLVWSHSGITTSAARGAACQTSQVTRVAGTGLDLLIMREPGDESVPQVSTDPIDPVRLLGLFLLTVAVVLASLASFVAGQERAACGTQCDGRPISYGGALYWLLGRMLLMGDAGGVSPGTTGARVLGLIVTALGLTVIAVIVATGVQTARKNKKDVQDLEDRVRQSLESAAKAAMGSVFINYRQGEDNLTVAGLCGTLSSCFGPEKVFMDIRSMPPGTRYPDALRARLDASDVLLAVIGQDWLTRLEQRMTSTRLDWVRFEISTAIHSGKTIIPVLLDDATLPTADRLPPDLAELAHRQVCQLRWTSLDEDTTRLVATITSQLRRGSAQGDLASA